MLTKALLVGLIFWETLCLAGWVQGGKILVRGESPSDSAIANIEVGVIEPDKTIIGVSRLNENTFGVSRVAKELQSYPFLVMAPGYQSKLVWLELGSDCNNLNGALCVEHSHEIFLKRSREYVMQTEWNTDDNSLWLTDRKYTAGSKPSLWSYLVKGKIDFAVYEEFLGLAPTDKMNDVVVVISSTTETVARNATQTMVKRLAQGTAGNIGDIAPIFGGILGWLAGAYPQVAAALIAVKAILGYLQPLISQWNPSWGKIVEIILGILGDGGASGDGQLTQLAHHTRDSNPEVFHGNERVYTSVVESTSSSSSIKQTVSQLKFRKSNAPLYAKQVFTSQIVDAWSSKNLNSLHIERDVNELRAVVVSGTVSDIKRLLELPNVEMLLKTN